MEWKRHAIAQIEPGSIAQELGIEPGGWLLAVNGKGIGDALDYHYLIHDEEVVLLVEDANSEQWEYEIEKDYDEDIGLVFADGLMDDYKSCRNKCIFCFIDQLPPGLRDTLYFKDDDARLSFLQGNYVTLTNMGEEDLDRIAAYRLSPVNISVHTTNPALRCKMLNNRFAGDVLQKIDRLFAGGIEMNGQIVLCKGINDGAELERSISDLAKYLPYMGSVSIVPVGLTKYRGGLCPLEPFSAEDAAGVLEIIHRWQDRCLENYGTRFVYAGDEWYLLAGQELPAGDDYEGYPQLENGVGMMRLLLDEFHEALRALAENTWAGDGSFGSARRHTVSIATGQLAAPFLRELAAECMGRFPNYKIHVYAVRNDFFGERITVSGLLTGQDIAVQLCGEELGERLLLPCNMLRSGEEVFLDGMTLDDLKTALQVEIDIVKSSGQDLLECMLGKGS